MYKLYNDKIVFSNEKFLKQLKYINSGSHADVYKIKINGKNYALKIFNDECSESSKNFKNKISINIDSFITPLKLLYINKEFSGYLMKYCDGKDLSQIKLNISLNDFYNSYSKLALDVKKLSEFKLVMCDVFEGNIIYNNGFKFIDTDCYIYDEDVEIKYIYDINTRILDYVIMNIFLKGLDVNINVYKYIKDTVDGVRNSTITFDYAFNEICNKAKEVEDVKTLNQTGKVLNKILKN